MKTLEEYKKDFLNIGKMLLDILQTDELVEAFSITRFASATAAILSEMGCFPQEAAFDDLFYDIERVCKRANPLGKDNHGAVLSIMMYCLLLSQSFRETHEEYYEMQQLKKEFGTDQGRKILEYIESHPNCLQREVAEYAGMTESNMSHFMAKNRRFQLWDVDKVGRSNYLRITTEGKRFIRFLSEEISPDDFPHNVNEENIRLKKQIASLQNKYRQLEEIRIEELLQAFVSIIMGVKYDTDRTETGLESVDLPSRPYFIFVSDEMNESTTFEHEDKLIHLDEYPRFATTKEGKLYEPSYT